MSGYPNGDWAPQQAQQALHSEGAYGTGQAVLGGEPGASAEAYGGQGMQALASMPLVDVVETADSVVVFVDVPGFSEDEIHIDADTQTLQIRAERGDDADEGERYLQRERPRVFERVVPLPFQTVIDDASASHEDGVCRVRLPKSDAQQRRTIGFE